MADAHWSTVAKDVVTTAGILIGGTWAFWKWGYGETLRRRREMASPDGSLEATAVRLDGERIAVTVSAIWRNRGLVPISLCSEHSRVEAFRIAAAPLEGPLRLTRGPNVTPMPSADFPWSEYIMEPNTDSVMHQHFVLDPNCAYGFIWTICLAPGSFPGKHKNKHLICTRELVWRFEVAGSQIHSGKGLG